MIKPPTATQHSSEYGQQVWTALRPRLIPYTKPAPAWKSWTYWRTPTMAIGSAVLLAAVFLGGRYWERATAKKSTVAHNTQADRRVVLLVLTDHLDQAERLLVELEHTDSSDQMGNVRLQSDAQELLASNRLYRDSARNIGDPAVATALEQLQGVLAEVADGPQLTAADLERVRKEMNIEEILFQIRVLRSNQGGGPKLAKGASI
jgi:hypothetical protein